jgi:thioredoxin-related protein
VSNGKYLLSKITSNLLFFYFLQFTHINYIQVMVKKLALLLGIILVTTYAKAQVYNINEAQTLAKKENKMILIKFSGSDWCGPCILFKKAIFDAPEFKTFADEKLVLVIADFPRQKKNQLPKEQQVLNDKLAEKYNPEGNFPFLVLADANGNTLKTWNGYDKKNAVADYIKDINCYIK